MNIIIMGPPGSGKTTQAAFLAKRLDLPHIETGAIYREVAQEQTLLGQKVKKIMDTGDLIDDATTFEIVDRYLNKLAGGFVVDGFPRTLVQAQRELFKVDRVINIQVPDQQVIQRLLERKREGETPEVIAERLRVYHQDTEPILSFYGQKGVLSNIDGSGTIPQVENLISSLFA